MNITKSKSFTAKIYIAGSYDDALRICRQYCFDVGYCVTVTRTEYVYKGGQESGLIIGLINYPRFPATGEQIIAKAEDIGTRLMEGLFQTSFSIETPIETHWYSRREGE